MQSEKVTAYLAANAAKLPSEQMPSLRQFLEGVDDSREFTLQTLSLQDPTLMIILSIFVGSLGIDRFILGHIGLGIGKLLTLGGCGVWTIVDLFLIMDATRQENAKKIVQQISL